MTLASEAKRLSAELHHLVSAGSYVEEMPWKIHDRGTDDGNGLGGPPFNEQFLRWMDNQVCHCGRPPVCAPGCHASAMPGERHLSACEPACKTVGTHFRSSSRRSHPHRLKRALRQLRDIAPEEFNPVYLLFARGRGWDETKEMVNESRSRRRQSPYTDEEFAILVIAGTDKLVAAW